MKNEKKYYDSNFWFNQINEHNQKQNVDDYGKNYYVYKIYENLIKKITDIPKNGYIVVLGTNKCVSFDLLCQHFGYDRCIGFDLDNPTNHPKVKIMDCSKLSDKDNFPISFVHNDLGSFPLTPKLKLHAQKWAVNNVIDGGYFLSRNNLNSAKFDLESLMSKNNFLNMQFESLSGLLDLSSLDSYTIEGHMLCKKVNRVYY